MSASAAIISIALSLPLAAAAPTTTPAPLYTLDRNELPHIDAVEYPLKDAATHIFSVPERNAVGTNSFRNAITFLDLSGPKVKYREVMRNFTDEADAGTMVFLPESSKDTIGYTQTRAFLLLDLKARQARRFRAGRFIEDTVRDAAVIDWDKRLFLFSVQFLQWTSRETDLLLLDLSGPEPKQIASFDIKKEPYWAQLGKTTFYFRKDGDRLVLKALDDRLRPTDHPILPVYNSILPFRKADLPRLHPSLPLAVFATKPPLPDNQIAVWAATWTAHGKPSLHKVSESSSGSFQFSPDGKWLLFIDSTGGPDRLVAMPVDPNLPHFLGPPILLQTSETVPEDWNGNCAWISDPVSVVCTIRRTEYLETSDETRDVNKLLKWELSPANVKK